MNKAPNFGKNFKGYQIMFPKPRDKEDTERKTN
jgi:hypothetical protein